MTIFNKGVLDRMQFKKMYPTNRINLFIYLLLQILLASTITANNSYYGPNIYDQKDIPQLAASENVPYWWMLKGSPFKRSSCDSNCISSSESLKVTDNSLDFSNNPFLNGNSILNQNHQNTLIDDITIGGGGGGGGAGPNEFTSDSNNEISKDDNDSNETIGNKFNSNPFLINLGGSQPSGFTANHKNDETDEPSQPFSGGSGSSFSGSGGLFGNNPFLSSDSQFGPISTRFNPNTYMAPGYLPPALPKQQTILCNGQGNVCVAKDLCYNGFVNNNDVKSFNKNCNIQTEVCCTIRTVQQTPLSVPIRVTNPPIQPTFVQPGKPFQPQPQTTECYEDNYGCVSPDQCVRGFVAKSTEENYKTKNTKCYAPEVCCRYRDLVPSSDSHHPNVEITPITSRPSVTPFAPLTLSPQTPIGSTVSRNPFSPTGITNPPFNTFTPTIVTNPPTFSQTFTNPPINTHSPSPSSPIGTFGPSPSSPIGTTPQRPFIPPAIIPQRPFVPPVTIPPQQPISPQIPLTPQQPITIPRQPIQPLRPVTVPERPFIPPIGIRQGEPINRPQSVSIATRPPFKGYEYIPPNDLHVGQPSNEQTNYLPPIRGEDEKSEPIQGPSNDSPNVVRPDQPEEPNEPLPPAQCPAATNCTELQFCTAQGVISKTPVILSRDQAAYRVPMSSCRNIEKRFIGKCCRDPDYVDPWPVSILGQYNATILGFDDGSYKPEKTFNPNPAARRFNPNNPIPIRRGQDILSLPIAAEQTQNTYTRTPIPQQQYPNSIHQGRDKIPPFVKQPIENVCATRNPNGYPRGAGPIDATFGEFPWQAMILKESTKTLVCGGTIVRPNMVATTASCVSGIAPYDLVVKGGEWRLGSDEEPKPFQIIRVKSIQKHPSYGNSGHGSDVAILHLENEFKFDQHIGAICFDENELEPSASTDDCVTTGWGKTALKYHLKDAVMHSMPIIPMSESECNIALEGDFNQNTAVCGKPQGDACQIDIGSALACTNGNGKYLLKGIYSKQHDECGSPSQIVTFTKMDTNFIKGKDSPNTIQPYTPIRPIQYDRPLSSSTQAPGYLPPY